CINTPSPLPSTASSCRAARVPAMCCTRATRCCASRPSQEADMDPHANPDPHTPAGAPWHIGGTPLTSRFLLGTAGYPSPQVLQEAIVASGSQVLTLGLKRTVAVPGASDNGFVDTIRRAAQAQGAHLLPNTAGCRSAREAITL